MDQADCPIGTVRHLQSEKNKCFLLSSYFLKEFYHHKPVKLQTYKVEKVGSSTGNCVKADWTLTKGFEVDFLFRKIFSLFSSFLLFNFQRWSRDTTLYWRNVESFFPRTLLWASSSLRKSGNAECKKREHIESLCIKKKGKKVHVELTAVPRDFYITAVINSAEIASAFFGDFIFLESTDICMYPAEVSLCVRWVV